MKKVRVTIKARVRGGYFAYREDIARVTALDHFYGIVK